MKQGLLIIDVQNDYFEQGKMPLNHPNQALKQIKRLENYFEANRLPTRASLSGEQSVLAYIQT